MDSISVMDFIDWAGRWVLINTALSLLLPPVEFFDDWPRFQKFYRVFGKFVKYWGNLNFRQQMISMYPQYQKAIEARENKVAEGK